MAVLLKSLAAVVLLHVLLALGIVGFELYTLVSKQTKFAVPEKDHEQTMRAVQFSEFGNASVLELRRISRPKCCGRRQVLVRIGTAALNPVDFKQRRNPAPGALRPLPTVTGFDFSGVVEAVGDRATVKVGDAVYGMLPLLGQPWGALQEYAVVDSAVLAKAPTSIPLREAAALPLVGLTVVQALSPVIKHWEHHGQMPGGKKILIQAGSGGVGTFAIQYCKHVLGMTVATTASKANAELLRDLGADVVVDYRTERFEDIVSDQDVVLDTVTQQYEGRTLSSPTVLKQGGVGHYVNVLSSDWQANSRESSVLSTAMPFLMKWMHWVLASFGHGVHYHCDPVSPDGDGLFDIAQLVDHQLIRPVVDRTFPLEEAVQAHEFLEKGHARGKVLVEVGTISG